MINWLKKHWEVISYLISVSYTHLWLDALRVSGPLMPKWVNSISPCSSKMSLPLSLIHILKLLDVDFDKKRISLSMKALLNDDAE